MKFTNVTVINMSRKRNCIIKATQKVYKQENRSWAMQKMDLEEDENIKYYLWPILFEHVPEIRIPTLGQRNKKYQKNQFKVRKQGKSKGQVIREKEPKLKGKIHGIMRTIDLNHVGVVVYERSKKKFYYVDNTVNCSAYSIFSESVRTNIISQLKKHLFPTTQRLKTLKLHPRFFNRLPRGCMVLSSWVAKQLYIGKNLEDLKLPSAAVLNKLNIEYYKPVLPDNSHESTPEAV